MQLTTLLPILALLATPIAAREPIDARRNLARHNKHVRAVDEAARNMQRRDVLAAEKPRARKVKRGANGCRVRGSSFAANSTSSSATSAAASATSSTVVIPTSASASSADASPSASPAAGENWVAPSSSSEWSAPSSAAPAASSAPASSGGSSGSGASSGQIGGKKAGLCGEDGLGLFPTDKFSWLWNYTPDLYGSSSDGLSFIPTLWGIATTGESFDSDRLAEFKAINNNPSYVQGFYEPDCSPPMSSAIDPYAGAAAWNELIVPHRANGAQLISPGMCKQADEDWLTPFKNQIGDANMWDITSVHINKPDVESAKKVLDHYAQYGKPMLITEFACVNDVGGFNPVEDQGQINAYINGMVDLLQNDDRVIGYSMSQGDGLAWNWKAVRDGALTESGQTYLNAVSKYY